MVKVVKDSCETEPILEENEPEPEVPQRNFEDPPIKPDQIEVACKLIMNSQKAEPLQIEKLEVMQNLLLTATNVGNETLGKQCAALLDRHLDKKNVLKILIQLSRIRETANQSLNDFKPSAPPMIEDNKNDDWVKELIDDLRHNCLLEIDKNADFVLKQKEMLSLGYNDILSIMKRDTLQVSNEYLVYTVVIKWGIQECHRRGLQPQPINIKAVLRDLVYTPRYGLMSRKKFLRRNFDSIKGPDRIGILEDERIEQILDYIANKSKNKKQPELPDKLSQPRIAGHDMPKKFNSKLQLHQVPQKKCVKKKDYDGRSQCEKWLINFLTCWTAIFD